MERCANSAVDIGQARRMGHEIAPRPIGRDDGDRSTSCRIGLFRKVDSTFRSDAIADI